MQLVELLRNPQKEPSKVWSLKEPDNSLNFNFPESLRFKIFNLSSFCVLIRRQSAALLLRSGAHSLRHRQPKKSVYTGNLFAEFFNLTDVRRGRMVGSILTSS